MGGRVGLKGTDGLAGEATKRGAVPSSGDKAVRALLRLAAAHPQIAIIAAHGEMGQDAAAQAGFLARLIGALPNAVTNAEDTKRAAREMANGSVELILFAGGDGTARDI